MRKADDELRTHYKRSDFPSLERGKFYKQAVKGTSVVLLDPDVAKAFPSSEAVNGALRGLLDLTRRTQRMSRDPAARSTRRRAA